MLWSPQFKAALENIALDETKISSYFQYGIIITYKYHLRPPWLAVFVLTCCFCWAAFSFFRRGSARSSSSKSSESTPSSWATFVSAGRAPLWICCRIRSRSALISCCWRTWNKIHWSSRLRVNVFLIAICKCVWNNEISRLLDTVLSRK